MSERFAAYTEYLRSEHWRILRQAAFAKAGRKCESCGSGDRLVGHHMLYRTPLNSLGVEDIMCLCNSCHDIFHRGLKQEKLEVPNDRVITVNMIKMYGREEIECGRKPKRPKVIPQTPIPRKKKKLTHGVDGRKRLIAIIKRAKHGGVTAKKLRLIAVELTELADFLEKKWTGID